MRTLLKRKRYAALAVLAAFAMLFAAKAWRDTMRDAVIERTSIAMPALPADAAPVRLALISDIHVAGPDMPPQRLERIVAQVNALRPDIVLIAGDLVSDKRTALRPPNRSSAAAN